MSSAKKNQQTYETLLKDYEQAQAQLTRTELREKAAKKNLKAANKRDASKIEIEILRLELAVAKAKKKARKAGASIAKIHIKQWVKANAKQEKAYKLTIEDAEESNTPVVNTAPERTKRKYTRREQTEAELLDSNAVASSATEGKVGISNTSEEKQELIATEVKKARRPRRSSAEAAAEREAAQAALKEGGDDFTIIEGIGPSVTKMLHNVDIRTFTALAHSNIDDIKALLKARRNNIADPTTWAQQAQLIVDNDWENLKQLQDSLKRTRS